MKTCPKCQSPHDKEGIFCSRSCANSRVFSKEAKEKKSVANKKSWEVDKTDRLHAVILNAKAAREKNEGIGIEEKNNSVYNKVITRDWNTIGYDSKRFVVMYEQKFCCNRCKINEWLGEKISLELEHKDGDRSNNTRENLECLCPNCHSLTETWRGKHRKKKLNLSDKEIYDIYISEGNVGKTIKALNLRKAGKTKDRILRAVERYILASEQSGNAADC